MPRTVVSASARVHGRPDRAASAPVEPEAALLSRETPCCHVGVAHGPPAPACALLPPDDSAQDPQDVARSEGRWGLRDSLRTLRHRWLLLALPAPHYWGLGCVVPPLPKAALVVVAASHFPQVATVLVLDDADWPRLPLGLRVVQLTHLPFGR
jgi:hypothetical protein